MRHDVTSTLIAALTLARVIPVDRHGETANASDAGSDDL